MSVIDHWSKNFCLPNSCGFCSAVLCRPRRQLKTFRADFVPGHFAWSRHGILREAEFIRVFGNMLYIFMFHESDFVKITFCLFGLLHLRPLVDSVRSRLCTCLAGRLTETPRHVHVSVFFCCVYRLQNSHIICLASLSQQRCPALPLPHGASEGIRVSESNKSWRVQMLWVSEERITNGKDPAV